MVRFLRVLEFFIWFFLVYLKIIFNNSMLDR